MSRLTYITDEGEYSVSLLASGLTADEFLDDLVRPLMLAAGYAPETVREVLDSGCDEDDDEIELGDIGV